MGKIIEGVWDCHYCGATKIRGSLYECPVCGRQRDNDVTFYIDNPHNYVSDEAAEKLNKNPDWLCSYCDALNSDSNENCYECGASREESELNYFENKKRKEEKQKSISQEVNNIQDNIEKNNEDIVEISNLITEMQKSGALRSDTPVLYPTHYPSEDNKPKTSGKKQSSGNAKNIFKIFGIFALIIAIITAGVLIFSPKEEVVTINQFEWERTVEVEEYRTVSESDWSVPDGGRVTDTRQEIRSYREVLDHYETKTRTYTEEVFDHYETRVSGHRDLGNGYFEEITEQVPVYRTEVRKETYQEPVYRQEPVYATKYYYDIERWVYKQTLRSSQLDHNPNWPTEDLSEKERYGKKTEKYIIHTTNEDGESKQYTLDINEWNSLKINDTIKIKTFVNGSAEIIYE